MKVLRGLAIAAVTVAAMGLGSATGAFAHGGGHGGGGWGGGHGGGGWHGGGWGGWGWGPAWGYYPYGPYNYGACYDVRQRIKTRHGWRVRLVSVCQ